MNTPGALLAAQGLVAGYGASRVLHGIDLNLAPGEAVALLGRNGAGKTTLVRALMGLATVQGGRIAIGGHDATRWTPQARCRAGLGWVPQERAVFPSLSVEENLTAVARPGRWTPSALLRLFPRLQERRNLRAGLLSGGEQQMLAMARALAVAPRVLLLDEPLEGLAPIIAAEIIDALARMREQDGLALLLVEQKAQTALAVTDRAVVLQRGRIVLAGESASLARESTALSALLGIDETTSRV